MVASFGNLFIYGWMANECIENGCIVLLFQWTVEIDARAYDTPEYPRLHGQEFVLS